MSWRKLGVLIRQLPPESATATLQRLENPAPPVKAQQHDAEHEQWSRAEQLLAAVKDELVALRYSYLSKNSKHRPNWKPTPTPRPGVKPKRARRAAKPQQVSALGAYLDRTQPVEADN